MAIGKIAFPAFTDSHDISTLPVKYNHIAAVSVITTKGTNEIKPSVTLPPDGQDRNANGEVVRNWYTGETDWYFLGRSSVRPFGVMIENVGTGNITNIKAYCSLDGLIWDSLTSDLPVTNGQNTGYYLNTTGEQLADGWYVLYHITCQATAKVAVQATT